MLSKHASSRGLEESVRHEGLVRKRGRLNTSFAERYFVLANGVDVFMCHTYLHTLCMCVSVCIWRGGYASREVKESCHTWPVCLCVCVFVSMCLNMCACVRLLCLRDCVSVFMSVYMSVCLCICVPCECVSVCLSVCLSQGMYLCLCLHACSFVCVCVSASVAMSVSPCVCVCVSMCDIPHACLTCDMRVSCACVAHLTCDACVLVCLCLCLCVYVCHTS